MVMSGCRAVLHIILPDMITSILSIDTTEMVIVTAGITWYVGTALQMDMRRAHFVEEMNHKLTRFFEALSIRPLEHDRRCWPVLARTL